MAHRTLAARMLIMAYTVLARRYRSADFDAVVGQDHIAQTLKRAIESGRIAHAYLFCGTRGTGKTSTARILAKCLNCLSSETPVTQPCGQCSSCQAISRGEDIDVIEIDAASNTGVDNIRELIENSAYRPARARFKVYIIDEVHMLSKSAFNALLKTLEEPPGHVKFILATTEPEKVLPTILSRCQRYDFRSIPTKQIAQHLRHICEQEKVKADDDAILLVARSGAGSMRDALSLLDRLLSQGETHLTADLVEQMLGLPRAQQLVDLVNAIGDGDTKGTLEQIDNLLSQGQSADSLLGALVEHLRSMLIIKACGPDSSLVDLSGLSVEQLKKQADSFEVVAVTQNIAILEELRRNLRQGFASRAMIDATMIRIALAEQFSSVSAAMADGESSSKKKSDLTPAETPSAQVTPSETTPSEPVMPKAPPEQAAAPEPTRNSTPTSTPGPEPVRQPSPPPVEAAYEEPVIEPPEASEPEREPTSAAEPTRTPTAPAAEATPQAEAPQAEPFENIEPVADTDLFDQLVNRMTAVGGTQALAMARASVADDTMTVRFPQAVATFARMFQTNGKHEALQKAVCDLAGRPMKLVFVVDSEEDDDGDTPPNDGAAATSPGSPARQVTNAPTAGVQAQPAAVEGIDGRRPLNEDQREALMKDHPLLADICRRFQTSPDSIQES